MRVTAIYSVPFFDMGDPTTIHFELDELTPAKVLVAINKHDADLAGLQAEEAAGFTMLSFIKGDSEAVAVLRTNGMGPRIEDNCLCTLHLYHGRQA